MAFTFALAVAFAAGAASGAVSGSGTPSDFRPARLRFFFPCFSLGASSFGSSHVPASHAAHSDASHSSSSHSPSCHSSSWPASADHQAESSGFSALDALAHWGFSALEMLCLTGFLPRPLPRPFHGHCLCWACPQSLHPASRKAGRCGSAPGLAKHNSNFRVYGFRVCKK